MQPSQNDRNRAGEKRRRKKVESATKSPVMKMERFPEDDSIGTVEEMEHHINEEHVTAEAAEHALRFAGACESVGKWRLMQGQLPADASHYLAELAKQIAISVLMLVEAGDVMLARQLPAIVETLRRAESVFGRKLTPTIEKNLPMVEILKEHHPLELIQMFAALHPDWAKLCGIDEPHGLLAKPEEELRQLLLSEETWRGTRDGVEFEERRKHRLAQLIEQAQAIREMQQPNINCFVEHLWQGRLWSGPNGTYEDCGWPMRPSREDVPAWMALIMPYLKRVTNNDATKLGVFRYMIAARSYCFDGQQFDSAKGTRLTTARPSDIWSQVGAEIRKAWIRMEKQARKPVSEKAA